MTRKLGYFLMVLALAASASATVNPGKISGFVRNAGGTPQMGATVEVLSAALPLALVRTDADGFYTLSGLLPGTYTIRVSAPSFLPSLREKISLQSGTSLVVNITLNTLFEAIQLVPKTSTSPEDQDDWKWTLRSMANRPVLRLADDGPLVVVSQSDKEDDKVLKAKIAFMAGSDGGAYSTPDMSTNFAFEQSVFGAGTLAVDGNVGYGTGTPSAIVRAAYKHQFENGSSPEFAITARRFMTPEMVAHRTALEALALSMSDSTTVADMLELNYGAELQTVQFFGRATAFRPFGSADLHVGPNTVVEYRYASSVPNMRHVKGFESAPADLSESGPRVSMIGNDPTIEHARHHEISISQRVGKNSFQAAYYRDRVSNPVITGVAEDFWISGDALPDIYGNTFNYNGGELDASGVRMVYQRKLTNKLSATLDYAFGGVLDLPPGEVTWADLRPSIMNTRRHAISTKLAGTVNGSRTRWIASYGWTSGDALTPVDMFNTSAGQSDPYLSFFIRQPIPMRRFIPAQMEALVDVRNLLAQGYRPVVGQDGHTVYLVQAARSVRGGVAFTF